MKCPTCNESLESGVVRLRGELWRQLTFWGMSSMRATFVPERGKPWHVVAPWQSVLAFRCEKCETVVVAGKRKGRRKPEAARDEGRHV